MNPSSFSEISAADVNAADVLQEKIQNHREKFHSRQHVQLALEGVTLALHKHLERLQVLEPRYQRVEKRYHSLKKHARGHPSRKRFTYCRKLLQHRKKLTKTLERELRTTEFFRGLLQQQIATAVQQNHLDLAHRYGKTALQATPAVDIVTTPEEDSAPRYQPAIELWRAMRYEVQQLLQSPPRVRTT